MTRDEIREGLMEIALQRGMAWEAGQSGVWSDWALRGTGSTTRMLAGVIAALERGVRCAVVMRTWQEVRFAQETVRELIRQTGSSPAESYLNTRLHYMPLDECVQLRNGLGPHIVFVDEPVRQQIVAGHFGF